MRKIDKPVKLNSKGFLFFYRSIYLLFMLLLLAFLSSTITQPPHSDWEITQDTILQHKTVCVNGSININSPYTLTIINSTIYMNKASKSGILVKNGATLNVTDSKFLNNTNYRYNCTVLGSIYMNNCEARGFTEIKLYSTSAGSINNTVIHQAYIGLHLLANSHDLYFNNVTVHNNRQHGFYIQGSNNTFHDCKAHHNAGDTRPFADDPPTAEPWYYGFQVSGNYNVFDNIEVYEEFTGVQVTGDYNNFTDSNAHDMATGYYGWWFGHYSDHNRLDNCVTYNITHGITLSNYTTVINHTAYNGLEGVSIGDYSNVLVENSTSYNMRSDGFVVAGNYGNEPYYTNNVLRNNTAFNCSIGPGFGFGMNSANVTVERCTSRNNHFGFGFYENASYITITNCSVYDNNYDFSFGYNSKAMKSINIVSTPSSGHLRFQQCMTQNVTLHVTGGILNCTTTDITIDSRGGSFCFTASNDVEIQINYMVLRVAVSGDQGNALRVIALGDTITVREGDDVLILWGQE